jgi:hypothetical protein
VSAAPTFDLVTGPEAVALASRVAAGCFQQPAWVRAVAAARGRAHELVVVRARMSSGRQAWLPGAVHRRFGLTVFEAMPMGGYGGWVGEPTPSVEEERDLTAAWLRRVPWAVVEMTSAPGRAAALPRPGLLRMAPRRLRERLEPREFSTHVLGLSADEAVQLQRARPSVRSYLRKVDQLGFTFERADDEAALARLHAWYVRGSHAWRQPASTLLPEGFFTSLAQQGRAEVWTVRFRGEVAGAGLFLIGRHEVQYQASGSIRIESTLSATEAMLWAAIRHYGRQGLATMNFGASEGLDSVARFKKKFGAEVATYRRCTYGLPRCLCLGGEPPQ